MAAYQEARKARKAWMDEADAIKARLEATGLMRVGLPVGSDHTHGRLRASLTFEQAERLLAQFAPPAE